MSQRNFWGQPAQTTNAIVYTLGVLILLGIVIDGLNRLLQRNTVEPTVTWNPALRKGPGNMVTQNHSLMDISRPNSSVQPGGKITRKTIVIRGSDIIQHIFYRDEEEIARQIIYPDGRIDQRGEIPDGKVEFFDEYNQTHGQERYENGRKSGVVKTFFKDGKLRTEEEYRNGQRQIYKEYYNNGQLRLLVDSRDARLSKNDRDEVGIGKLYYPDGILKYEWNLTNSRKVGYKKSYNSDGQVRAETYYDEYGQVMAK